MKAVKDLILKISTIEEIDDVKCLNRACLRRINQLKEMMLLNFVNGDHVEFEDRKGEIVKGVVRGLTANNKKNLPIVAEDGIYWRVGVSLVKHCE